MSKETHEHTYIHIHQGQDKSGNGLALTGLILGILACLSALIPLIGTPGAVIMAIIGIPLAAIGLTKSLKRPNKEGRGLALSGLILCATLILICFLWPILFFAAVSGVTY